MDDIYKNKFNESSTLIYDIAKLSGFSIDEFNNRIYALLNKEFKGETLTSGDTQYVGTSSLSDLLIPALLDLEDHSTRNDNPHEETAESIGTLRVADIEALDTGVGLKTGLIPLDVIGYDTKSWEELPLNNLIKYTSTAGGTIKVSGEVAYSIYATPYLLQPSEYVILEQCPNWPNVDVHLYMGLKKGISTIMLYETRVADTIARIYMGTVARVGRTLSTLKPVIRMSGMRLSVDPVPYGLPVGPGTFRSNNKLHGGWLGAVGDITPPRPSGLSITFTSFTSAAGGRLGTQDGKSVYVLYSDYKTNSGFNDTSTPGVDNVAKFDVYISGLVTNVTWGVTRISGGIVTFKNVMISAEKDQMTFEVDDLPLGLSELTLTATDSTGDTVVKKLLVKCVAPLELKLVNTTMSKTTGTFAGSEYSHYYNAVVNTEYSIVMSIKGDVVNESPRYSVTSSRPGGTHTGNLVKLSSGNYTIRFNNAGTGNVIVFIEDTYGSRVEQNINVSVKLDPPPIYMPVFTGYTADAIPEPLDGLPDFRWYNTTRIMTSPTVWPYVEYDVEYLDANMNYSFEFTTVRSSPTIGFKVKAVQYGYGNFIFTMEKGTAIPPAGRTVQYVEVKAKVSNLSGEVIEDTYYLRFIYNG